MRIAGLKVNESEALIALKEILEKEFNLVDFCVYGSKVRGTATSESDIDVMVELEDLTPEIEALLDSIIFRINLKYDCFISAIIYNRKELEDGPMQESPLFKVIEREGIRI